MQNHPPDRKTLLKTLWPHLGPDQLHILSSLPVETAIDPTSYAERRISLPDWGHDIGVNGVLSVPAGCASAAGSDWREVDWFRAIFVLVTCEAERIFENAHGPVHSYAYRLPRDIAWQWHHAWVNRIYLFLRRWAAVEQGCDETSIFGERARARIFLSHDVDYVSKTFSLRLKQSVFSLLNFVRTSGPWPDRWRWLRKFARFAFMGGDYWQFPHVARIESDRGMLSTWNLYGGKGGLARPPDQLILDPYYAIEDHHLRQQLVDLVQAGHCIGLHQAFHSWRDAHAMRTEMKRVEAAIGISVRHCRQHWLRFSFEDTWRAQEAAGLTLDMTLGFNDRPGYRNSALLKHPAWISADGRFSNSLHMVPMVLMDSHLFDYGMMDENARRSIIDQMLDELALVGGEASIVWHQRVFHSDYSWGDDYEYLLDGILKRGIQAVTG